MPRGVLSLFGPSPLPKEAGGLGYVETWGSGQQEGLAIGAGPALGLAAFSLDQAATQPA